MQEDQAFQNPDPTRRRLRMLVLGLGVVHLLLPSVRLNTHIVGGYYQLLAHDIATELVALYVPVGAVALAFLCISLWRAQPCDWRGADRVFGILLAVAAGMKVLTVLLGETPPVVLYTEGTQRLLHAMIVLRIMLLLSSVVLFFARSSWAVVPLGFLVPFALVPSLLHIEPNHPDLPKYQEQETHRIRFLQAVDDTFWTAYWDTREPEQVAALFAGLDSEARAALSNLISEDAVGALLERGDDSAFLQAISLGLRRRDENGDFVGRPARRRHFTFAPAERYLLCVAFAYALVRVFIRRRSAARTPHPGKA